MRVAVDLPLRDLLHEAVDFFASTRAFQFAILRYVQDGIEEQKFLNNAADVQKKELLDSWLPNDLKSKLEVSVSTNLIPTLLPDSVVEVIAMNSILYPSTIRNVIASDIELAHDGQSSCFGNRQVSFDLRAGSSCETTTFTFDDYWYDKVGTHPSSFRGAGITAVSGAVGKHIEYSYESEPSIKDFLDSLRQTGRKVTCPICGTPFIGEVPCMTPKCIQARKQEAEDYTRHRSEVQKWLINEAREGRINSAVEFEDCKQKLKAEYPDAEVLIHHAFRLAAGQVIDAYWEANADLKAIVEEEAEKYAHEAIECDREAKRLADELNSLPGFKLFGNGALKAQKDELAKCIEKTIDDAKRLREKRDKVLDQLKRLPKR